MSLKGGPVEALFPDGTKVPYSLTDGVIKVELMGTTYAGSWDGAKLVVDGTEATKQP